MSWYNPEPDAPLMGQILGMVWWFDGDRLKLRNIRSHSHRAYERKSRKIVRKGEFAPVEENYSPRKLAFGKYKVASTRP